MKKIRLLIAAVFALLLVSCATVPDGGKTGDTAVVEKSENKQPPTTRKEAAKKPRNPFFEDDDIDSHYDDEDEDETEFAGWFFSAVRAFWHTVTFSGRALR